MADTEEENMIDRPEDYPNTLRAQEAVAGNGRPRLFDPALKHFPRAYQLGDYVAGTSQERGELERVRAQVRGHLLRLIATSRWRDHLILRGSVLMQWWFGEWARDPKDIDWVFQPQSVKPEDALAQECLNELIELVRRFPRTKNAEIITSHIVQDEIWTYERAEGRRLLFPFQTADGTTREVQMDIVWDEPLHEPAARHLLRPENEGDAAQPYLLAASPALSLAWKLLWVAGDMHPQAKDFYDSVLLAEKLYSENTPLSFDLLRRVFDQDEWWRGQPLTFDAIITPYPYDWDEFRLAYPWIGVEEEAWRERLRAALTLTFEQNESTGPAAD